MNDLIKRFDLLGVHKIFDSDVFQKLMNDGKIDAAHKYCTDCNKKGIASALEKEEWAKAANAAGIRGFHGPKWRNRYHYYKPYKYVYGGLPLPLTRPIYYDPYLTYSNDLGLGVTGYYPYRPGYNISTSMWRTGRRCIGGRNRRNGRRCR